MEKVNVAVMLPLDRMQRELLKDAGAERCEWHYIDNGMGQEERLDLLREAEVVMGQPSLREIRQCPRLKWIQMSWAGTDIYTSREGFPREILLTNASGCFQVVIGEYVMAVLLSLCRRLNVYAGQQREGYWHPLGEETLLYGKRALILGAGDIGTGIAKRLKAFGVHVTGMRRTDRNYPDCYDAMVTPEALDWELPLADIVIGCLPDTQETRGLLDIRRLCMMGPDAFLINVGRGSLIPTDELVEVLEAGHLGGVALDVVTPEPLPADHPLWKMKNVILTPHIAGQSFGYSRDTANRVVQLCAQNLERYLAGRELVNRVDLEKGYAAE